MNISKGFWGICLALTGIAASCSRKEPEKNAGKGGSITLNCVPKHHNVFKNIINGKIYIAYNTSDVPLNYDDSASCIMVNGTLTAVFTEMKPGAYYLVGKGFDTTIQGNVTGGVPYTARQDNVSPTVVIPVTEGD